MRPLHDVDPVADAVREPGGVADDETQVGVGGEQAADDFCADLAGGSGDDDHDAFSLLCVGGWGAAAGVARRRQARASQQDGKLNIVCEGHGTEPAAGRADALQIGGAEVRVVRHDQRAGAEARHD